MRHKIGAADDEDVEIHNHLAWRNVVELADDKGNDVGSATVATHREGQADAAAAKGSANDGTHKRLEAHLAVDKKEVFDVQHLLPEDEAERAHHNAIDGVGSELGTQHLEADGKQYAVDNEIEHTDGQRDACRDVEHGRDTADAATDNLGWQHKRRPRKGVDQNAERDDHIRQYQFRFILENMHIM